MTHTTGEERPRIYVDAAENDDEVRTYYELPDAVAERIRPEGDTLTLDQALQIIINHPVFHLEHFEAIEEDLRRMRQERDDWTQTAAIKAQDWVAEQKRRRLAESIIVLAEGVSRDGGDPTNILRSYAYFGESESPAESR